MLPALSPAPPEALHRGVPAGAAKAMAYSHTRSVFKAKPREFRTWIYRKTFLIPKRLRPVTRLGSRVRAALLQELFICTLPVAIYVVVHSPGNAAACFTQVAICASSSSSSSWMSM